jgi:hypothetical protein
MVVGGISAGRLWPLYVGLDRSLMRERSGLARARRLRLRFRWLWRDRRPHLARDRLAIELLHELGRGGSGGGLVPPA